MSHTRRRFIAVGAAGAAASLVPVSTALARARRQPEPCTVGSGKASAPDRPLDLLALALHQRRPARDMDKCIDLADEFGFNGVEDACSIRSSRTS